MKTLAGAISKDLCDAMGHFSTRYYAALFDDATIALLGPLATPGVGWADVVHHIEYHRELGPGQSYLIESSVTRIGRSSVEYRHRLFAEGADGPAATLAGKAVSFDLLSRTALPLSDACRAELELKMEL